MERCGSDGRKGSLLLANSYPHRGTSHLVFFFHFYSLKSFSSQFQSFMTIDEDMNCFVANTWNRKIIELRGLNEEQEKEHVC